jgi:hypothetical protein
MPDTARLHDRTPLAATMSTPSLQIVPDTAVDTSSERAEPNVARSGMVGYAIGFVVVTAGITLAGTISGLGFANSVGLGAFVGFWGGGGFGFMLGTTIPFARYLDAQSSRSNHHEQGETNGTAAR